MANRNSLLRVPIVTWSFATFHRMYAVLSEMRCNVYLDLLQIELDNKYAEFEIFLTQLKQDCERPRKSTRFTYAVQVMTI